MSGGIGSRRVFPAARAALAVAVIGALAGGCAAPAPAATTVPTFPTPTTQAAAAGPAGADGTIPDDCAAILAVTDLEALLGLPLGSVAVRTTIGVAEASVGRSERVSCTYSGVGPVRGATLLGLNATAYTDQAAADKQWRVNVDAEDGTRREMAIGSAAAIVVERPRETVLMVVHGTSNLTLVLPDRPLPGDRPRADAAVDLALRVLPAIAVVPAAGPTVPGPVTSSQVTAGPARAAGS